jgi:hypothetical protein
MQWDSLIASISLSFTCLLTLSWLVWSAQNHPPLTVIDFGNVQVS